MMAVGAGDGKDSAGQKVVARNGWQKYVVYPQKFIDLTERNQSFRKENMFLWFFVYFHFHL